ncbi:MAG: ABC transporter permease subunit [Chromatiales bacterium]|jgi:putrescine transport system permease protein|nr:ABC transporter permease subunit [Chromatiales bacterium]MDH4012453.1 ABC transporter permease subunit [Chromatiales bacterium]PLX57607.1 MAG: putrescine ABC transporter permease PotI [Chromatiales bacterium]
MRGLVLAAALVFLYLPMLLLIIYSFNESRLVTVWSGWSVKWYGELLRDQQMIGAIWMSLRIAFLAATAALVLGVLAGVALTRVGAFRGKALLGTMITAPLVIPEVITGLSLLLLFVALGQLIGWPAQRGMLTIWIAHVTFCTAYVTLIVAGRLSEFDHSIEEAAMDLGATPLRTFFQVTLPVISPALIAAWLLAFTLSLDDLVIASFVTGPGASTLPIVVFSSVRLGVSPKINALATILIVVVMAGVLTSLWLMRRYRRRQQLI